MRKQTPNVHCLCIKKTDIVGFVDICLPDDNEKGKMVNVCHIHTHVYIDQPVTSYDQYTCSGLVNIC